MQFECRNSLKKNFLHSQHDKVRLDGLLNHTFVSCKNCMRGNIRPLYFFVKQDIFLKIMHTTMHLKVRWIFSLHSAQITCFFISIFLANTKTGVCITLSRCEYSGSKGQVKIGTDMSVEMVLNASQSYSHAFRVKTPSYSVEQIDFFLLRNVVYYKYIKFNVPAFSCVNVSYNCKKGQCLEFKWKYLRLASMNQLI